MMVHGTDEADTDTTELTKWKIGTKRSQLGDDEVDKSALIKNVLQVLSMFEMLGTLIKIQRDFEWYKIH